MFRLVGFLMVTALAIGGWEAGAEVLESLVNAVKAVLQRRELGDIQKSMMGDFQQTGRLPTGENSEAGPLYSYVRSKITANGRDPGLDFWESPYWYATGQFYRHYLDPTAGQFAIGSPGPDKVAFTRDDVYVICGP